MSSVRRALKIVTVGDGAVGKTSFLIAYTQGAFESTYVPTVFDNYAGNLEVGGKDYNFTLWDTAGQEEFDKCRVICYNGTSVFLVCFSVDNKNSYLNVENTWIPEIKKECGDHVPIILVGTKCDLRDTGNNPGPFLKKADGKKLAKSLKLSAYMECSAKEMTGLQEVFVEAIQSIDRHNQPPKSKISCVIL